MSLFAYKSDISVCALRTSMISDFGFWLTFLISVMPERSAHSRRSSRENDQPLDNFSVLD
jgi:hypothetical protein